MKIQCGKCGAKFRLADDKVTEKGVKVRCSKCDAVFRVNKPSESDVRGDEMSLKASAQPAASSLDPGETQEPATTEPEDYQDTQMELPEDPYTEIDDFFAPSLDIFISYASPDKDGAYELVRQLEDKGVTCWIARRNIRLGHDYGEEIVRGIRNSILFVVVFSAHANASKHVLREVDRALEFDKLILPIKIDESMPTGGMEYRLCTPQWLDAGGLPLSDQMIQDTLKVLGDTKQKEMEKIKPVSSNKFLRVVVPNDNLDGVHTYSKFGKQPRENLPQTARYRLEIVEGHNQGEEFIPEFTQTILGRRDGDIILNDMSVSSTHAMITYEGYGQFVLRDLRSTNGTFLNEKQISEAFLHDGDLILLGATKIKFHFPAHPGTS